MLTDIEISQRVTADHLIDPFRADGLLHCRYNLRAARVFSAETGLWERYAAACDYVSLSSLAEAHDMFAGFEPIT